MARFSKCSIVSLQKRASTKTKREDVSTVEEIKHHCRLLSHYHNSTLLPCYLLLLVLCTSCSLFKDQQFSTKESALMKKYQASEVLDNLEKSQVKVTFYGTSSLLIADQEEALLIDGFFSRPEFPNFMFSRLAQRDINEIKSIIDSSLVSEQKDKPNKKLRNVVAMHSHHDHAMDSPCIANAYAANLIGSQSSINIHCEREPVKHSYIVPELKPANPLYRVPLPASVTNKFGVTMLLSQHGDYHCSPASWFLGIGKKIKHPLQMPKYIAKLKEGQSYSALVEHPHSGLRMLIHGSPGFEDGVIHRATLNNPVDWLFLSIGGLARIEENDAGFAEEYFKQTIDASGAKYVVPIHWDDFTQPVSDTLFPPKQIFGNFVAEMELLTNYLSKSSVYSDKKLILLNFNEQVTLPAKSQQAN